MAFCAKPVPPDLFGWTLAREGAKAMQGSEADALRTPVSVSYARALVRAFGKTRGERDELLQGTAIQQDVLDQPGAHMPVSSLVILAANITRRHGELWPLSAAALCAVGCG